MVAFAMCNYYRENWFIHRLADRGPPLLGLSFWPRLVSASLAPRARRVLRTA
jgi:hypothetical protein